MTNIKYIKRNRHHKKNFGGGSFEDNKKDEIKSFYQNGLIDMLSSEKRKDGFGNSKWNQLNFK